MLDLKKLKKDPKSVVDNLKKRGFKLDLDKWDKLEASRKSLQSDTEKMQAELNEVVVESWKTKEIKNIQQNPENYINKES